MLIAREIVNHGYWFRQELKRLTRYLFRMDI